jgi:hypothetical protein
VPTLRPGDVVIMDNLRSHKVAGLREAIEAAGASLLFIPPYSPDLKPNRTGVRQTEGAAARQGNSNGGCAPWSTAFLPKNVPTSSGTMAISSHRENALS